LQYCANEFKTYSPPLIVALKDLDF